MPPTEFLALPTMTIPSRFQALFSPHRRWLDADSRASRRGGWLGPIEWVVPRASCIHRRFAFPGMNAVQRQSALALAAKRAAPSDSSPFMVRWQGDTAQVWWVRAPLPVGANAARLLPETALLPMPTNPNDARLLALSEGVEGQVWRDGILWASRWWAEAPDAAEWQRFLRGSAVAPGGAPSAPSAQTFVEIESPWGQSGERLMWSEAQLESLFWTTVVLLSSVVLGWQLLASVWWGVAAWSQERSIDALRREAAPQIEARETAESANTRLAYLDSLSTVTDYRLLADVRERLPAGVSLLVWVRDASELRLQVAGPDDPRVYVDAFAGHPVLSAVVANPLEPGRMQLDVALPPAGGEGVR